jgi:DNA-binding NarL/FixJ family response regulator
MKILVVDDHVLIREALRGVLRELKGEDAVVIEAADSRQAMRQIEQNPVASVTEEVADAVVAHRHVRATIDADADVVFLPAIVANTRDVVVFNHCALTIAHDHWTGVRSG